MKYLLAVCAVLLPLRAHAEVSVYLVICNTEQACGAAPVGSAINRIVAAPNFAPGPGLTMVPDDNRAMWVPTPPVATTLEPEEFINRFSTGEQQAIITAALTNWQLTLWLNKMTAATLINVTDSRVTTGMQVLVGLSLITQSRANQVLDLSQTSP